MLKAQHPRTAGQEVPCVVKGVKACRHRTTEQAAFGQDFNWCMSYMPTGMELMFGRLLVCHRVSSQYGSNNLCQASRSSIWCTGALMQLKVAC